jgi:hypothetical protein
MPSIEPKNRMAQLDYRARGNSSGTQPASAISNFYPGLEFDFRNVWKNLFEGIELHEAPSGNHVVLDVVAGSEAAQGGVNRFDELISVDDLAVSGPILPNTRPRRGIEFFNSLSHVVAKAGTTNRAKCTFRRQGSTQNIQVNLRVRTIFAGDSGAIDEALAEPGALTQSLCSPWQADYRECMCFYWSSSRPDFVNVAIDGQGNARGINWMQLDHSANAAYSPDDPGAADQIAYEDLYTNWEGVLRFVIGGREES